MTAEHQQQTDRIELMVCTTCKRGQQIAEGELTPGAKIFAALNEKALPDNVSLRETRCFSNCKGGCSVGLRGGPKRWTYVYGNFAGPEDTDLILDGAARYAATEDGLVPWRERPEHFKRNCIARIPPLETPEDV